MKSKTLTGWAVEFLIALAHWLETNLISQGLGLLVLLLMLGVILFSCGATVLWLFGGS